MAKAKKKKAKRNEIRITDPTDSVWMAVTQDAIKNKRTIGKEAETMLEELLSRRSVDRSLALEKSIS